MSKALNRLAAIDWGLLTIRAGLGTMMIVHGWPKLAGGSDKWVAVGASGLSAFGEYAGSLALSFGLMAALAETLGGLLVMLGLQFRVATLALVATMIFASLYHIKANHDFPSLSHSIEVGIVFLGLFISGPGRLTVQRLLKR